MYVIVVKIIKKKKKLLMNIKTSDWWMSEKLKEILWKKRKSFFFFVFLRKYFDQKVWDTPRRLDRVEYLEVDSVLWIQWCWLVGWLSLTIADWLIGSFGCCWWWWWWFDEIELVFLILNKNFGCSSCRRSTSWLVL